MLIKFIVCNVPQENRERFSLGQQRWSALASAPGFRGQVGGWNDKNPAEAVIIGLWQSDEAYAHFMQELHDPIFEESEQQGSYDAISATLWNPLFDVPGSVPSIPATIEAAGLIRIAHCGLLPGRRDHFIEVQRTIWNPGMGACDGMLAGVFSQSHKNKHQFLVCTLWRSVDHHRAYVDGVFSDLRRRAEVEKDCASLIGYVAKTRPDWTVPANPGA